MTDISCAYLFFHINISKFIKVTDVQVDDHDRYTCTTENIFGRQEKTTTLLITGLG